MEDYKEERQHLISRGTKRITNSPKVDVHWLLEKNLLPHRARSYSLLMLVECYSPYM